jgi:hypothetical protein
MEKVGGLLTSGMNVVCYRPICDDTYACQGQTVLSPQGLILRFVSGHLGVTLLTDASSGSRRTVLMTPMPCLC